MMLFASSLVEYRRTILVSESTNLSICSALVTFTSAWMENLTKRVIMIMLKYPKYLLEIEILLHVQHFFSDRPNEVIMASDVWSDHCKLFPVISVNRVSDFWIHQDWKVNFLKIKMNSFFGGIFGTWPLLQVWQTLGVQYRAQASLSVLIVTAWKCFWNFIW